jgi:hypothetical protein
MTTTPEDPDTAQPDVVPSSDPNGIPTPASPGEDPGTVLDTEPDALP